MGNHLSGIAPSQILPVENYIIDLNNKILKQLTFHKSLGSTRFLKVVMCLSDRGPVVIKVFVIHDAFLDLTQQETRIKALAGKLTNSLNCLPFHEVELTEKAAFIIRQFVKSSLYDRISTRPFLANIEKKWLAFQLLCALHQCEEEQICHGDIKLENVLVTSWSWLILSDFACYKPVFLPDDNPTDFTYFFDTSRRRVCNIAPERFIKVQQKEDEQVVKEALDFDDAKLTHSMDMFSAGCVLIELFTEGFYPFNLMQLLQYRSGSYYPQKIIDKISDEGVKRMLEEMISKDPHVRKTASEYLEIERGKIFPNSFYSVLWPYCKQFSGALSFTSDERIQKLEGSLPDVLRSLFGSTPEICSVVCSPSVTAEIGYSKYECDKDLVVILTSLVSSCIRALHFPSSKLIALKLFRLLSQYASSDVVLDRILPYIIDLLKDPEPTVRAESLSTMTKCITLVTSVPRSDVNIFLEYILPNINDITQDNSVIVRQSEAAHLSVIADTAVRFVEHCSQSWANYNNKSEVQTLQEIIQQKLAKLFSDPSSIVKRTLIDETLNSLCLFFGKEKANDVLLSHLITFLNEKKDYHLRLSFYKNITGIAAYMGTACNPIWKPLLLQGLSDVEETITLAALEAMSAMAEIGIFPDHSLLELSSGACPLLIHPNLWIRQAIVGFVVAISKVLSFLDVQTSVASILKPFLKKSILQYRNEACILSALREPLPRAIYDTIVKSSDASLVMKVLRESSENKVDVMQVVGSLGEGNQPFKHSIKRLLAAGLTDSNLPLLFILESHVEKVNRYRKVLETLQTKKHSSTPGVIDFRDVADISTVTHKFKLISNENFIQLPSNASSSGLVSSKSSNLAMNEEWQAMFGGISASAEEDLKTNDNNHSLSSSKQAQSSLVGSSSSSQAFAFENSTVDLTKNVPNCQRELENLLKIKREDLKVSLQCKKVSSEGGPHIPASIPSVWKPKGHLVAHLHEHKDAITRLVPIHRTSLYASSSKDGTVKIWDANKTEKTFPINRSRFTYSSQRGVIAALAHCPFQESIASSSDNGSIHVFRLDKQSLLTSRQLDKSVDGYALDLNYLNAGVHSLLTYSTVYGKIVGWDLRSPSNAWVLDNDVRKGLITSYDIDKSNNWLACGTSSGSVVCWDLRFLLPISHVNHPHSHAVQRLKIYPGHVSGVMTSFRYNNEVVLWDMETQSRTKTLWASQNPPLSEKPSRTQGPSVVDNWVYGLLAFRTDTGGVAIVTVGTDSRIRYWDLDFPASSFVVSHPALFSNPPSSTSYKSRVIDGSEVITEAVSSNPSPSNLSSPPSVESPKRENNYIPTGHIETITDAVFLDIPQKLLISSGYDGTIKLWK